MIISSILEQNPKHHSIMCCDDIAPEMIQAATKFGVKGFLSMPLSVEKVVSEMQKYNILSSNSTDEETEKFGT